MADEAAIEALKHIREPLVLYLAELGYHASRAAGFRQKLPAALAKGTKSMMIKWKATNK